VKEVPTSAYGGVSAGPIDAIGNVLVVMTPKESGGVATLDISDPLNPVRLASFTTDKAYIGHVPPALRVPDRSAVWDVLTNPKSIGSGSSPIGRLPTEGSEYMSFQRRLHVPRARARGDRRHARRLEDQRPDPAT
jgi:hypothetical protein